MDNDNYTISIGGPSKELKVMLYDISKPVPFMQGEGIKAIHKQIHGRLVSCGECLSEASILSDEYSEGTLLYVNTSYEISGNVESLWFDDGCSVRCAAVKFPNKDWEIK